MFRRQPAPPLQLIRSCIQRRPRRSSTKTLPSPKPRSRQYSSQTQNQTPSTTNTTASASPKLTRFLSRLPKSLRPVVSNLQSAPISHIAAFLILHEITAIIPLVGLFGVFHWGSWLPLDYVVEHWGTAVRDGVNKFERYFKRKGWFGFTKDGGKDINKQDEKLQPGEDAKVVLERWEGGKDPKYKILVEIGLAWAITKAMLPMRVMVSMWGTPWFARILVGARKWLKRGR